ncbi:hypothetical protein MOMMJLID_CDS0053 [Arthrobacter phage 1191A]|nr:hypothetical protein MOMMJLID_CDS0053 [Arthrobacter phage 1191A]
MGMTHQYQTGDYVRIHDHDGAEITVKITDSGIPNRQGDFAFKAGARMFKNSEILGLGEVPVVSEDSAKKQWDLVAENEAVKHPAHYGGADDPYEAIKVIEAWDLNFNLGSVLKYVRRAGKKDASKELEDLRKARFYIDHEITRTEQTK